MDIEDESPKPPPGKPDLEIMSIAALEEYIVELETEIARARAAIDAKRAIRGSAEGLFSR